jgi:hypothetical protein
LHPCLSIGLFLSAFLIRNQSVYWLSREDYATSSNAFTLSLSKFCMDTSYCLESSLLQGPLSDRDTYYKYTFLIYKERWAYLSLCTCVFVCPTINSFWTSCRLKPPHICIS